MQHVTNFVITLKEIYNKDFNKVHTYLLRNNIKIEDYLKNYGVFFLKLDKNQLNILNSLKNVAEIEESQNVN